MANRPGFIIKNTADAGGNFRISEPDAVDFLTLGNQRYGVIAGCQVEVAAQNAASAQIRGGADGNILLVNGNLRFMDDASVSLFQGNRTLDRFDLVIYDDAVGRFQVLEGVSSNNPVFPELNAYQIILAAVFVPAGATSVSQTMVTDKRLQLNKNFLGTANDSDTLIQNLQKDGQVPYRVLGNGTTVWKDVTLKRSAPSTIQVDGFLDVTRSLTATQKITGQQDIEAKGLLLGANFKRGAATPSNSTGERGDLYQRTSDGALLVKKDYGWAEVYADEYPPGTIISSILTPDSDYVDGWLHLNGATYPKSQAGRLWEVAPSAWKNLGAETITLPNMSQRLPMQVPDSTLGAVGGSMLKTLVLANLPAHTHFGTGATSTGANGAHSHSIQIVSGGGHSHDMAPSGEHNHHVEDNGHNHPPIYGAGGFICTFWDATFSQLDGPIADASHTYRVAPSGVSGEASTGYAATGVRVTGGLSAHVHTMETHLGHTHGVVVQNDGAHTHALPNESAVGSSTPFDTSPAHLVVNYYIKT